MDIKSDPNYINMRSRPLIFLDLETTGLTVQKHEIVEVGAIKVSSERPFKILGQLSLKAKPKNLKLADKDALKIIGYSDKDWTEAIDLSQALLLLDKFSDSGVLVGFK